MSLSDNFMQILFLLNLNSLHLRLPKYVFLISAGNPYIGLLFFPFETSEEPRNEQSMTHAPPDKH